MIRQKMTAQLDQDPHFTWRGEAVTRVENLSDIVFALALGMLVSASQPPDTLPQMTRHLVSIVPVAAGFAILCTIWNAHFTFFRRYGLVDLKVVFINAAMLLVILYIAYPLRFIFDSLFAFSIWAVSGDISRLMDLGISSFRAAAVLMGYFMAGYAVIYGLILSLYTHALKKADILDLSPSEIMLTRRSIWMFRCELTLSVVGGILAVFTSVGPWAGFLLVLNWPVAIVLRKRLPLPPLDADPEVQTAS